MSLSSQNKIIHKKTKEIRSKRKFVKIIKFWLKNTLPFAMNILEPINSNKIFIFTQIQKKKKFNKLYLYIYTITLNLFYKKIKILNLKNPTLSETHAQTIVAKRKAEK